MSPATLTSRLSEPDIERLHTATVSTLNTWVDRLRSECRDGFPEGVTAFRQDMAVHGRYNQPCVRCGSPIQRIRYADNETNYCARCQTGGKLLSDRAFARLLGQDWPKKLLTRSKHSSIIDSSTAVRNAVQAYCEATWPLMLKCRSTPTAYTPFSHASS